MALRKTASKKTPKKAASKKTGTKKAASKKAASKKSALVKTKAASKKNSRKKIIPLSETDEISPTGDCMCRQKRPNGKYFSFRLVAGVWMQSSAVPFPTQEICEDANC